MPRPLWPPLWLDIAIEPAVPHRILGIYLANLRDTDVCVANARGHHWGC
jgi:hypothetical protein